MFFFLVVQPFKANLIVSLAIRTPIDSGAQAILIEQATAIDKCNSILFDAAGDKWLTAKQFMMAAHAYGRGVICSPGDALLRFKYGEMLYAMGFLGDFSIDEAIALEPHNPLFKKERDSLKVRPRQ